MKRRKVYGITEVAERLGVDANTVAQWRFRGKLPEPTEVLARGPVWDAADIEPWFRALRRLEQKMARAGDAQP